MVIGNRLLMIKRFPLCTSGGAPEVGILGKDLCGTVGARDEYINEIQRRELPCFAWIRGSWVKNKLHLLIAHREGSKRAIYHFILENQH